MRSLRVTTVLTYGVHSLAGVFSFSLPKSVVPSSAGLVQAPADVMRFSGVIHDFASSHPDFDITDPAAVGHFVGNVGLTLARNRRPAYTDSGHKVTSEWHDKDGNQIAPYAGPGLPGGHFDVDVYDEEPSTNKIFHEHEYDDDHDITYVDVVNNPLLEGSDFDSVVGGDYPNNLRLEFLNVQNGGGGSYTFEAGGPVETGETADGFTTTFDPALLTQLRISFIALAYMRATKPNDSQADAIDRDDAFHLRMYDVVTDEMVYELALYHHFKAGKEVIFPPPPAIDACGEAINDIAGSYGIPGSTGVTDLASFDEWFRDVLGTNQAVGHTISLQRDAEGVYEYMTDDFYPIDYRLMGNEGDAHNNFFTYTVSASFTYHECTSQFFEFASNDDAWVFVDDRLVIDLGGTATPETQYVDLDRVGLVDGEVFSLRFFFAHRREALDSLFHMRTNILLTTGELPSIAGFND